MPPKKKPTESKGDEFPLDGAEAEFSVSSPLSAASTASVTPSLVMSTEQLQLVLESVLGRLTPLAAHAVSSPPAPK